MKKLSQWELNRNDLRMSAEQTKYSGFLYYEWVNMLEIDKRTSLSNANDSDD